MAVSSAKSSLAASGTLPASYLLPNSRQNFYFHYKEMLSAERYYFKFGESLRLNGKVKIVVLDYFLSLSNCFNFGVGA